MNIETKLRHLREQNGYSQEYMAEKLKISQKTYSNIETGKTDIRFSVLEKCSEILGISLLQLLPEDYTQTIYEKVDNLKNQIGEKNKIINFLIKDKNGYS